MRLATVLAFAWVAVLAGDKWAAPIALRKVQPPRADVHPIDSFLRPDQPVVSDGLFARRAYLDLWGLLPTPEQLAAFERNPDPGKREQLIDRLLAHKENYSSHWISFWNDLLRNDEGVIYHGERESITPWLKPALEDNVRYDQFVRELLNPAEEGEPDGYLVGITWRGLVNASELPPMQAAQNSAQVFLGVNLKCNSCHDSFISTWKLSDAYGLASFFSDTPLELVRCDVKLGKKAQAKFLFPELGAVPEGLSAAERRELAARLFTAPENGRFARTYVNRIWAQLFGAGLTANPDDMALKPSNPDLLDWLASDFAAHGYDTKQLLKTIMTSRAYQAPAAVPRRLSAEQFSDAISAITGEWRALEDRETKKSVYAREWRFKSSPLSRALGRPIRDQVTTTRLTQPTTLQALELVNGSTLAALLERGARRMLGQLPPAPVALFDSGVVHGGKGHQVDIDITGLSELWLVMKDIDSYDAPRVHAGWANAQLTGPNGTVSLSELASIGLPFEKRIDLRDRGYTRFRAMVALDAASTTSDVNAAVRFFAFPRKPDYAQLLPIEGNPPVARTSTASLSQQQLIERLYRHALARGATPGEAAVAREILGNKTTPESLEDLLWVIFMNPEFQFIR